MGMSRIRSEREGEESKISYKFNGYDHLTVIKSMT